MSPRYEILPDFIFKDAPEVIEKRKVDPEYLFFFIKLVDAPFKNWIFSIDDIPNKTFSTGEPVVLKTSIFRVPQEVTEEFITEHTEEFKKVSEAVVKEILSQALGHHV